MASGAAHLEIPLKPPGRVLLGPSSAEILGEYHPIQASFGPANNHKGIQPSPTALLAHGSLHLLAPPTKNHVMSIDLDWAKITSGSEGAQLAASIRDFIHDKFQRVQLPRFIRSVNVHSFEFGKEAPTIEIKDICDPWDEFYEDEEEDDEEDDHDRTGVGGSGEEQGQAVAAQPAGKLSSLDTPRLANRPSGNAATASSLERAESPNHIDTHFPNLRAGFSRPNQDFSFTPSISRTSTPISAGIPGGTSNFSYFHHLPLNGGLSGTTTPLAGITPLTASSAWHDYATRPSLLGRTSSYQDHRDVRAFPQANESITNQAHSSMPPPPLPQTDQHPEEYHTSSRDQDKPDIDRASDLQTMLHISYDGNLSLSLTAEILLDYPMPSFVSIPLKLQITGLSFDGVGVVAYLRQPSTEKTEEGESKRKVHFCFLSGDDAEAMMDSGGHDTKIRDNVDSPDQHNPNVASAEETQREGDHGSHEPKRNQGMRGKESSGPLKEILV